VAAPDPFGRVRPVAILRLPGGSTNTRRRWRKKSSRRPRSCDRSHPPDPGPGSRITDRGEG
jgi:hypothetical protein